MTRTPAAQRRPAVGPLLQRVALSILDDARAALANPDLDAAKVIHETRKAMKRWRALLRLLSFALGDESRRLRTEARDLARSLGGPRDAQSAMDALDDVLKHAPDGSLPTSAPQAMRLRLHAIRVAMEAAQLDAPARARLIETLDAAAESVRGWPLAKVRLADLAKALAKSYRRGRRLVPADWQAAEAEHLHELRQRTVELRHQLECVAPILPGLPRSAVAEPQRLRNRLGRHQDLTLLGPLMAKHQPLARWRSRLAPLIAARQAEHVAAAERIAAQVFRQPRKDFRKWLLAHTEAPESPPAKQG